MAGKDHPQIKTRLARGGALLLAAGMLVVAIIDAQGCGDDKSKPAKPTIHKEPASDQPAAAAPAETPEPESPVKAAEAPASEADVPSPSGATVAPETETENGANEVGGKSNRTGKANNPRVFVPTTKSGGFRPQDLEPLIPAPGTQPEPLAPASPPAVQQRPTK